MRCACVAACRCGCASVIDPVLPQLHSTPGGCEEVGDRCDRVPGLAHHSARSSPGPAQPRRSRTSTSNTTTATSFYYVVDTRAWLRDPAPLFRTNVEGLRHVLDAAMDADLRRFVFTSTIGTIGMPADRRPATEEDEFNWADTA